MRKITSRSLRFKTIKHNARYKESIKTLSCSENNFGHLPLVRNGFRNDTNLVMSKLLTTFCLYISSYIICLVGPCSNQLLRQWLQRPAETHSGACRRSKQRLISQSCLICKRIYHSLRKWVKKGLFEEPYYDHEGQLFFEWSSTILDWSLHLFECFFTLSWNGTQFKEWNNRHSFWRAVWGTTRNVKSGVFHSFTFREHVFMGNYNSAA